jgi:hypothetical protein
VTLKLALPGRCGSPRNNHELEDASVSQAGEDVFRGSPGQDVTRYEASEEGLEWADLRRTLDWLRTHKVLVWGALLIVVALAWKAQFLGHLYFRQDDFHDLDIAAESPLGWHYLTYIGAGHLIIGLRLMAWLLVRISLYNWALASAVSLAFVAAAGIAALRLLRTLFGERPAILIPLLIYLFCPLTLPDLGEWSSALESAPLQLAIFMALAAHVWYIRTGRARHLIVAAAWVAFGLLFFEKGLVLPPLLFAVTSAFLAPTRSWLGGMWLSLVRCWRAWLLYLALMAGYAVLLVVSLHTSSTQPRAPASAGLVGDFARGLTQNSLLPGFIGGPWQWLQVPGGSYAFAAPPAALVWIALLAVAAVILVSVWRIRRAWRAWMILIAWVAIADMLPVIISRLGAFSVAVLGTETRYVADAVPVLAICVGLAFLPLAGQRDTPVTATPRTANFVQVGRASIDAAAILVAIFVFGSIWSSQAYENVTTGSPAASYIADATDAIMLAPRGTQVIDLAVPGDMVESLFGRYALQSTVIGDIKPGKLRWIRRPAGTWDGLRIFGSDGRLYQASIRGVSSLPLSAGRKCWPTKNGQTNVRFQSPSPSFTSFLRIGYVWFAAAPGDVAVHYPGGTKNLVVKPGLHSGYVRVSGSISTITVDTVGGGLCIGDAQAGALWPNTLGQILPSHTK